MSITITGSPKEIAALVDELQERRILTGYLKSSPMTDFWKMDGITTDRIASCGPTAEKLGDPTPCSLGRKE